MFLRGAILFLVLRYSVIVRSAVLRCDFKLPSSHNECLQVVETVTHTFAQNETAWRLKVAGDKITRDVDGETDGSFLYWESTRCKHPDPLPTFWFNSYRSTLCLEFYYYIVDASTFSLALNMYDNYGAAQSFRISLASSLSSWLQQEVLLPPNITSFSFVAACLHRNISQWLAIDSISLYEERCGIPHTAGTGNTPPTSTSSYPCFQRFNCWDRNNSCFDLNMLCDGINDCPNGYDEQSCYDEDACEEQLNCLDSLNTCYDISSRCDRIIDCPNMQDELECDDGRTSTRIVTSDGSPSKNQSDLQSPSATTRSTVNSFTTPIAQAPGQIDFTSDIGDHYFKKKKKVPIFYTIGYIICVLLTATLLFAWFWHISKDARIIEEEEEDDTFDDNMQVFSTFGEGLGSEGHSTLYDDLDEPKFKEKRAQSISFTLPHPGTETNDSDQQKYAKLKPEELPVIHEIENEKSTPATQDLPPIPSISIEDHHVETLSEDDRINEESVGIEEEVMKTELGTQVEVPTTVSTESQTEHIKRSSITSRASISRNESAKRKTSTGSSRGSSGRASDAMSTQADAKSMQPSQGSAKNTAGSKSTRGKGGGH